MKHIFISYVRDDQESVNRLWKDLRSRGINVWLDREDIMPGQRWRKAIRRAIREGAFFLACFSCKYSAREKTYMNEELILAIEELRQRSSDKTWFIPVRLEECEVPDREIGGGENLTDLQWADLFPEWGHGLQRILQAMGELEARMLSAKSQLIRWGPNDDRPAGILINSRNGSFIPWNELKQEIEERLLNQVGKYIPVGCSVVLKDLYGRKDWIVRIISSSGKEVAGIWFGSDPNNDWSYDGSVRIGKPIRDGVAKVWQTFQRFSDGTYRRLNVENEIK